MKLLDGSIEALAKEGRHSIQIPEIIIGSTAGIPEIECPNDWFWRMNHLKLPCRQGFLYLTRKGYAANRENIREAFLSACRRAGSTNMNRDWAKFEKSIDQFFADVDTAVRKKIASLRSKIAELERFNP